MLIWMFFTKPIAIGLIFPPKFVAILITVTNTLGAKPAVQHQTINWLLL